MNLFLDTNTLLTFYHFSSDDLEELRKLAVLIKSGEVTLYLPEQVIREYRRNREVKIADALKQLRAHKIAGQFPQMSMDYAEYDLLRDLQRRYAQEHENLLGSLERDVELKELGADVVIEELLQLAVIVGCDSSVLTKARERHEIGNPPGKRDSLGDAVNWEALLSGVPEREDLFFVSADSDFVSPVNQERFNEYLSIEWAEKKDADIHYFKRLSAFLREHYPEIKLATEAEKDLLIRSLAASGSFRRTHEVVSKLRRYSDFTPGQVAAIVAAAVGNTQVSWIAADEDVREFLEGVVEGHEAAVDDDQLTELQELMRGEGEASIDDDEWPF